MEIALFLLVVIALALATAWAVSVPVTWVWLAAVRRRQDLARWALFVAAVPWIVGFMLAVAAVFPGDPHLGEILVCHCLESMPSWLHLCPVHPGEAAGLAVPAAAVVLGLLPGRFRALSALVQEPLGRGGDLVITKLDAPIAVLVGWLHPTLVVDSRLWAALSVVERQALLAHEGAHLMRRDPLVLMFLRALLVVAPSGVAGRTARAWLNRAELEADAEAAKAVGDPLVVASTLVNCARVGRPVGLAAGWTGGSLERRVHALLEYSSLPTRPVRPDLGLIDIAALSVVAVFALVATPWVHHQVEHLLNLSL